MFKKLAPNVPVVYDVFLCPIRRNCEAVPATPKTSYTTFTLYAIWAKILCKYIDKILQNMI
jgi:hypothetical protein